MPNPSRPWLRLWDCTLDLPKAQRLTGDQFKGWVNLLMLANRQDIPGMLPELTEIAFSLRLPEAKVAMLIEVLVGVKLIDREGSELSMHDWERWQPPERTNAERSREWREDQKASAHRALGERSDEALGELRARDALARAEQIREEKIREEKIREDPPTPRRGKSVKPTFVVPEWVPLDDWNDWLEMRASIKKKPTEHAKELAVKKLATLQEEGHDASEVLQQSTLNSWQDLFPIRVNHADPRANGTKPKEREKTPEELAELEQRRRRNLGWKE